SGVVSAGGGASNSGRGGVEHATAAAGSARAGECVVSSPSGLSRASRSGSVTCSSGSSRGNTRHPAVTADATIGLIGRYHQRGCTCDRPSGIVVDSASIAVRRQAPGAYDSSQGVTTSATPARNGSDPAAAHPPSSAASRAAQAAGAAGGDVVTERVRGALEQ